jgi:gamma-glutamyltranspeptidase
VIAFYGGRFPARADYIGSASVVSQIPAIQTAALNILGDGGGFGSFQFQGGGNAVDAAVAAALVSCVVNTGNSSLGGYGGHMMIYKSGLDGDAPMITCVEFGSPAGSLASSNMFLPYIDPTTGAWVGPGQAQNLYGWKAIGVPGTFGGLYVAQTNFGRKNSGTNVLPFAEMLKPALANIANGTATGNAYYALSSVSNLVMDLYTNSPGYVDQNGNPNPYSANDPYKVFYAGDVAQDIVAAMQTFGGLVTYADMTNYKPRIVQPYMRHFSPPGGTPAWVCTAPIGASGITMLEELAIMEALGWTNGPAGTWDTLHYWHGRAEGARLAWKDHFQWLGDPYAGIVPPDFMRNGSTNYSDQILAHATNGYPSSPLWDSTEIRLTNSIADSITQAVNGETNVQVLVHWNDVRYGTCNISTCDRWGNCVAVTFSMGGGFGAQVGVTNRGLVFGQGMSLFELRPGWPNSIAPGKCCVDNMCPSIVIPDSSSSSSNTFSGGRPPFAVGGVGGSTIENNMTMEVLKYITDPPSSRAIDPTTWMYNFEANTIIYFQPSYPAGVKAYLPTVGLSTPGSPPSVGQISHVEAFIAPQIVAQPYNTNCASGGAVTFTVQATGVPLFYQWYQDGGALTNNAKVAGAQNATLTVSALTSGSAFYVVITNAADSVTSATAAVSVNGAPVFVAWPRDLTNAPGTLVSFVSFATGALPMGYQWKKNGTNVIDTAGILGSGANQLNIGPLTNSDAGVYSAVASNAFGMATSQVASLTVSYPPPYLGTNWSASPLDSQPWMTLSGSASIPNQRTIAYNALSNHLYVVSRSSSTTSNYVVYVLNATNQALLYTLKTNGIQSSVGKGGIGLVGIGVADDGAIYACNMATDAEGVGGTDPTSEFRLYRWADANPNTAPTLVFIGDPSSSTSALRWGDSLAVRGAGTNTQVLVDMTFFGTTAGTNGYAAVLSPSNRFMTNFVSKWFTTTNFETTVGRTLDFDSTTNAIWQSTPGKSLYRTTFDPKTTLGGNKIASSTIQVVTNFSISILGLGFDFTNKFAAGVVSNSTTTADSLSLYDIGNLNAPSLLSQAVFPTNPRNGNNNAISQTIVKNGCVFSINGNNGILSMRIAQPLITLQQVHFTEALKLSDGTIRVGYTNPSMANFKLFASTNLINWSWIGVATQSLSGTFEFVDPSTPNLRQRFYQLRSP